MGLCMSTSGLGLGQTVALEMALQYNIQLSAIANGQSNLTTMTNFDMSV